MDFSISAHKVDFCKFSHIFDLHYAPGGQIPHHFKSGALKLTVQEL